MLSRWLRSSWTLWRFRHGCLGHDSVSQTVSCPGLIWVGSHRPVDGQRAVAPGRNHRRHRLGNGGLRRSRHRRSILPDGYVSGRHGRSGRPFSESLRIRYGSTLGEPEAMGTGIGGRIHARPCQLAAILARARRYMEHATPCERTPALRGERPAPHSDVMWGVTISGRGSNREATGRPPSPAFHSFGTLQSNPSL